MKSDQEPASDNRRAKHLAMNRKAWDAYQSAYMEFHLKEYPDFFEYLSGGGVFLSDFEVRLAGEVAGLAVLDVCCASSADEAFSWENLGANVIACDITPVAIEIAKRNAVRLKSHIRFVVADAQELAPIASDSVDLLYGRYLCWFEDLEKALRAWYRVVRPGGRLLLVTPHPTCCCLESEGETCRIVRSYDDESPDYHDFTGTDMADRHGGWGQRHPCVEFFHPTWRIINAVVAAGFCLRHVEEPTVSRCRDEEHCTRLPHSLVVLAEKLRAKEDVEPDGE